MWDAVNFYWTVHFIQCVAHLSYLPYLSLAQLEEAKKLVRDAIAAGIFCDLGSGSNVDLCVITHAGVQYLRGYDQPAQKGKKWAIQVSTGLQPTQLCDYYLVIPIMNNHIFFLSLCPFPEDSTRTSLAPLQF